MTIPVGLCQCGCGQPTARAKIELASRGYRKGDFQRYVPGHSARTGTGKRYRESQARGLGIRVYEHIQVVERAMGRALPPGAVVHHVNGDTRDNRPGNLVVCQDQGYHALLHQRQRAMQACGNPSWRRCKYCKTYDDPAQMYVGKRKGESACHRECRNQRQRAAR